MSILTRSVEGRPDRPILRGATVGTAAGLTAGTLYAAITPGMILAEGAIVGMTAGLVAGILHALLDRALR